MNTRLHSVAADISRRTILRRGRSAPTHVGGYGVGVRGEAGFTMAEIAIALGVIAFALIAIIGILPAGLQIQRDNREETIINQDARLLLGAIQSGGRDSLSDLGSFVVRVDTNLAGVETRNIDYSTLNPPGIPTAELVQLLSDPFRNHRIVLSAVSGAVASRGSDLGFRYVVLNSVMDANDVTNFVGRPRGFDGTILSNQVHEVRLRFAWPVKPDGNLATEANRYVARALISGWHTNGVFYAQEYLNR